MKNKERCTGCGACACACPTQALFMEYDHEGFYYPKLKPELCISCDECKKVCFIASTQLSQRNLYSTKYYAGYLKDTTQLTCVSSGGAFWGISEKVLSSNGIVYGAVQESIFDVHHERANTIIEAKKFQRSKYLQSSIGNTYIRVQDDLMQGRVVLFSGTGCQIAGLYGFLKKTYDNLITCDVVCHGIPSMKAFKQYIHELEIKHSAKVIQIVFRDKTNGWKNNHIAIYFDNDEIVREPSVKHLFHAGYLSGLYCRSSCENCDYASLPRVADITLADYWMYEGPLKLDNPDGGISLIVCSTEKGNKLIKSVEQAMRLEISTQEKAMQSCKHLIRPPIASPKRMMFFKLFKKYGFEVAVQQCSRKSFFEKLRIKVGRNKQIFLSKLLSRIEK